MKIDLNVSNNLLVEHGKEIEGILRLAVQQALLAHKRAGNPIASWEKEKVILISPEKIAIDDALGTKQT